MHGITKIFNSQSKYIWHHSSLCNGTDFLVPYIHNGRLMLFALCESNIPSNPYLYLGVSPTLWICLSKDLPFQTLMLKI